MGWKDYFYFQKGDKIAITILLFLIVIAGCLYIATKPQSKEDALPVSEFSDFQPSLIVPDSTKIQQESKPFGYVQKLRKGETIEINEADTSTLKKIPGIGSTYANRILKYRNLLGGYYSINQLKEVYGIDNELYHKIIPYITAKAKTSMIKINSADFQELIRHPYLNKEQVRIILDIRKRKGKIESINRLTLLEEFSSKDIKRLTPYLSFD